MSYMYTCTTGKYIWVIPCEITQKSAILTPTPFDFGENWWTYSTPWPKHVRTILALGDLSGQILEVIIGHDFSAPYVS